MPNTLIGTTVEARYGTRLIADLCPGVRLPQPWTPDNLDTLGFEVVGRLLHVVDFERDHAVAKMLLLRGWIDRSTLVSNQLDHGAAQIQVHKIDRHALNRTALFDPGVSL
jgi:hypothetical protein